MDRTRSFLFILLISSAFFGCQKEPIERESHENLVLDDNKIPPYSGVSSLTIQNYINKMFIDLMGVEPTSTQMSNSWNFLVQYELSDSSKEVLIDAITSTDLYYRRLNEIASANLLEGVDSSAIAEDIIIYTYLRDQYITDGYIFEAQLFSYEIILLQALLDAKPDLKNGNIAINEFYARYINNEFYDQINMGSLNFALSCFENLMKRQPTDLELANSIDMVDGQSSQLFLDTGDSKGDFINIFTNNDEFYQGLVWDVYQSLLARKPDSREMSEGVVEIKNTGNLRGLQKKVAKTKEYAGF